ncbi:MAG: DUF5615 family PIN-like protein [Pyrinomonadaceae bacterium]|nr:DUF5615 family PIN-like protein [Pyrinomonadaceae bacterium]MBP6213326.1 DUF5615 family PIN-like protein [Pyrinomonadaceae bacterium]
MTARLLFDQNLSPKLVKLLADIFPNSNHLYFLELATSQDLEVWNYAKQNGFVIVTKDVDFADMSILYGFPPKVLWMCRGNCSTTEIEKILRDHQDAINGLSSNLTFGIYSLF